MGESQVREIIRGLSNKQKEILRSMREHTWYDLGDLCRQKATKDALYAKSLIEPRHHGTTTLWYRARLTPLGVAVMKMLKTNRLRIVA